MDRKNSFGIRSYCIFYLSSANVIAVGSNVTKTGLREALTIALEVATKKEYAVVITPEPLGRSSELRVT